MRTRYLLPAAAIPILLGALLLLPVGCGTSEKAKPTSADRKIQEDPWLKVQTALRQESDPESARRVLNELNRGLASESVDSQRKLGDADAEFIRSSFNLTEAEMKELRSSGYTPLDANHLAEALYLRDVAKSLDIAKLPVSERAAAALQWVCRQVLLQPWFAPVGGGRGQPYPPLPPTYVLRRGSGSGLERLIVFVSLCRQLDIDAYPIGPAAAAGQPMLHQQPGKESEFPRGPFWGVGVRDGADVLLFDPWKEQALPGKAGRPATLANVRADPRSLAIWLDNKEFAWSVSADDLKAGEVFLIAPLSALAPRNRTLEEKLAADLGAKLALSLSDLRRGAELAAKGVPVRVYSPANEAFAPTRSLASFLPATEGGTSVEPPDSPANLYGLYIRSLLPQGQLFAAPAELESGEARTRLRNTAVGDFANSFLIPPTPRERIQRGQFVEVTKLLVKLRDRFASFETHKRAEDREATRAWIEQADALGTEFNTAKRDEQPAIRARLDEFWKGNNPTVGILIAGLVAQPGIAEATFLLALAKHEQAERVQAKAQRLAAAPDTDPAKKDFAAVRTAAADAWIDARDWWGRYEPLAAGQSASYPGRAELAKRLTDRAAALAGAK